MTARGGRPVEFWRFGGTPQPATQMGRIARRFEELGWDGMVVGEDHGVLPDPYVTLSLAAATTTRLKLGTGVSVPIRHPFLAANAIATLHAVSGGRTLRIVVPTRVPTTDPAEENSARLAQQVFPLIR
jgi:5,10-methylenetetrahydromethanopterin reductase